MSRRTSTTIHWFTGIQWSTPRLLRAGAALVAGLALAAAVMTAEYAASAHDRIAAVAGTDAPSVLATSDFLLRVEDMDAQLANALLISGDGSLTTMRLDSERLYEADRMQAERDLQAATTALADDPAKLDQLAKVANMFGTYEEFATRAVQLDERSGAAHAGSAPSEVVAAYREALSALAGRDDRGADGTLIAEARDLDQAGADAIAQSTRQARDTLDIAAGAFLVVGALPLAALVFIQVRAARKFHRRFHRGLLGASAATALFMIIGFTSCLGSLDNLHNGKENAFDSVLALTMAKAASSDANADESRWLLDQENAPRYASAFLGKARQIAASSLDGGTLTEYETSMAGIPGTLDWRGWGADPLAAGSAFGTEFRNLTFDGEADAALTAFKSYVDYLQADSQLRTQYKLTTAAGLHDAIDFDTDARTPGTSDQRFTAYAAALDKIITLNRGEFESSMTAAENGLSKWSTLPYGFFAVIAGLTVLGLWPRLREYR